ARYGRRTLHTGPPPHRLAVDVGADVQDRVVGQLDAVGDAGGVVHEDVAVALALGVGAGDLDEPHVDPLPVLGPRLAGVGRLVLGVRELGEQPAAHRELVEDPGHQVVVVGGG